ncbi:MAG: hypothetical protein RR806_05675 [Oscillospiraceae bacterium]
MIGYPFIWAGKASENYGISIVSINETSWNKVSGGATELITDTIDRNPELLFLGAKQTPILSFPLEFVCESTMDIQTFITVKNWLFGELSYKQLKFCIDGLETYYFNCVLKSDEDYIFEDGYKGFKCTVECDSPFAWENTKVKSYMQPSAGYSKQIFNNLSANSEMLKPVISFTCGSNGNFKIINKSLNDLTFEWNNLQNNETITCDCQSGIITSSSGLSRFDNFNKHFLKLKKGVNNLEFWGNVSEIKFTYKNAIRLGGGLC